MKQSGAWRRWLVLAACFFLMAVCYSLINTIHTLFIVPVTQSLGFSIGSFSVLFTIAAVATALASPLVGRLLSRWNIKWVMALGTLLAGGGFWAYSLCRTLPAFYAVAVVVSVGLAMVSILPISTLLTGWFPDKTGMVLGIAFAGTGCGSLVWMQVAARYLAQHGYVQTYRTLGLIILVVALPLTLLAIQSPPATPRSDQQSAQTAGPGLDRRALFSSPVFLLFVSGLFLLGLAISGTQVHVQSYLSSLGYSSTHNANVGSVQALAALVGTVLGGIAFDRLSLRRAVALFGGMALASYVCFLLSGTSGVPYLAALFYGLCLCLASLLPAYGTGALFARQNYAATLGTVNLIFILGSALGPTLSGFLADAAGYRAVWITYLAVTAVYLLLLMAAFRSQPDGEANPETT